MASDYETNVLKNTVRVVEDYRKAHPEAGRRELIDAAWLAAVYMNTTAEKSPLSDYWLAMVFSDALRKLKLTDDDAGVGFINSRSDVATKDIMNWTQPHFGTLVGDTLYLSNTLRRYLPGEMPGDYQGEEGGAFPVDRSKLSAATQPTVFKLPVTKPAQNRAVVNARVTLDPDSMLAHITADVALKGTLKVLGDDITGLDEWAIAVEDFLGIPENKRYRNKKADPVARETEVKEAVADIAKALFGKEIAEVGSYAVNQHGVVPGAPELKLSMSLKAEGRMSDAGNDLLLNAGSFAGNNVRLEGDERNRQLDAFYRSPTQYNYNITFVVPDGYEVDPSSLEALKTNENTIYGSYYASARMTDDGNVLVNIKERYNAYVVPVDKWEQILQIYDAAAAFNDAPLLLKKK